MTPHEIELAQALAACTYLPGTPQKRFARDLAAGDPNRELTERQRHYMEILAWRMRRQMPKHLVPEREPLDLPPKRREPKKRKAKNTTGDMLDPLAGLHE